ncbi:sigma-54-dependent Fis family transcriptional regulator [Alicyclobacillus tolerans]|uniref:sigma-54-dependent Fis family transcriptional regulator n=1 Tax=Alicyclobacillus tolerans TaxID=90970 RepID=UPI001F27C378|nr:sigma-54-dependent Fis family transcriptional regulator [Alicyclobacillus tolerans]MCF8565110.1 sigma-54-dependent Fis family transcriptional regulator [Alicyclobacillus tolerans]
MPGKHIAVRSFDDYRTRERALYHWWENMQISGRIDLPYSMIASSWQRCLSNHVNPLSQQAETVLKDDKLRDELESNRWLIDTVTPYMVDLFEQLGQDDILTVLTNDFGMILKGQANSTAWRKVEPHNFIPGSQWSEQSAGTNAIGTALVEQKPIQVFAAQHFCQGSHPWVCSAAPIRDPVTNTILGVLDITGKKDKIQAYSLPLVVNLVKQIQASIHSAFVTHDKTFLESMMNILQEPVLIFDSNFKIVRYNSRAEHAFHVEPGTRLQSILDIPYPTVEEFSDWGTKLPAVYKDSTSSGWSAHIHPYKLGGRLLGGIAVFQYANTVRPSAKKHRTYGFEQIVTRSPHMIKVIELAKRYALSNATILISGETGVGKEVVAQSIHAYSTRAKENLVTVNCGAIPKELLASELFGYNPGAFTGANHKGKPGKFQAADGGTIFLDEIGELSLEAQVYLLRVLEERVVVPVGGVDPIVLNVRVIAATNRDLASEVRAGRFREDLYYRLNVLTIHIPPLREHREDIPVLVERFLKETELGKDAWSIDPDAVEKLVAYRWPGNVRQLKNAIYQAAMRAQPYRISSRDLPVEMLQLRTPILEPTDNKKFDSKALRTEKLTKEEVVHTLLQTNRNVTQAAKVLQVSRMTMYRKMKEFDLSRD